MPKIELSHDFLLAIFVHQNAAKINLEGMHVLFRLDCKRELFHTVHQFADARPFDLLGRWPPKHAKAASHPKLLDVHSSFDSMLDIYSNARTHTVTISDPVEEGRSSTAGLRLNCSSKRKRSPRPRRPLYRG